MAANVRVTEEGLLLAQYDRRRHAIHEDLSHLSIGQNRESEGCWTS